MEPDFWRARWKNQEIGFHQATASWALDSHYRRLDGPRAMLVPLAGKSLDVAWLRDRCAATSAIELVDDAVRAFFAESIGEHTVVEDGPHRLYRAPGLRFWSGDFFALTPRQTGPIDGVFDRAALIALPPLMRPRYITHLRSLLEPDARILVVTLEYDPAKRQGPPFPVTSAALRELYADAASIELLEERDILPLMPRFQAAGVTTLIETAWLVRL